MEEMEEGSLGESSGDDNLEFLNEDEEKSSDDEEHSKSRKRRTFESNRKRVTEACIPCKERHLKCDSKQPCLPCTKRKVQCTYAPLEVRKKRGRKPIQSRNEKEESLPTTKTHQEQEINVSQDTKIRINSDKVLYASSSNESIAKEPKELMFSQPSLSSFSLSGTQTDIPLQVLQTYSLIKVSTLAKLHWYSTLAVGAQLLGNRTHAHLFSSQSRSFASELFDVTSPIGVSCFGIMAYYYAGEQDFERSNYFYGIAKMMSETFISKKMTSNEFKVNSFSKSLIGCATYTSNIKELIDYSRLARFLNEVSTSNFALSVFLEVTGIVVMTYQSNQTTDYERLLKHIAVALERCKSAQNAASESLLQITEARILRDQGKFEEASVSASKALDLILTLDKVKICTENAILALGFIVGVASDLNSFELLQTSALKLLQLGNYYGFPMYILKCILKCKGFENIPGNVNDFLAVRIANYQVPTCGFFVSEFNALRMFGKILVPEGKKENIQQTVQNTNQQQQDLIDDEAFLNAAIEGGTSGNFFEGLT